MEWVLLGVAVVMMLGCGLFVAAEFSFLAVDRAAVDRDAAEGDPTAKGVQTALTSLSTQLSGAQIGITLTNLLIGLLAQPAIAEIVDDPIQALGVPERAVGGVAVAFGLIAATAGTMVVGELIPKQFAISVPMATARLTQRPMRYFTAATYPLIRLFNGTANAVVRSLGVEPQEELRSARSSEELASLAHRSASEGKLAAETATLVQRTVAFGPRTAGEIMTPRMRVETVEATDTANDVIALSAETGKSRFPVVRGGPDEVVGMIHVKQAVAVPRRERGSTMARELMVDAPVVPESLRLDPLLTMLRGVGFQMVIVSDEYGGTAGIVTLEDAVEEIVGDIADEHDDGRAPVIRLRGGSWLVSGLMRPDEVLQATGINLPEHEDYDTVAGLFIQQLGRMPAEGDVVDVPLPLEDTEDAVPETARLAVVRMDGRRIDRIAIHRRNGDPS